jgi:hypothetical protein
MDYAMIGKIEKAKRYAEECKDRVRFKSFRAKFQGDNSTHTITYDNETFNIDDEFFDAHGYTQHTMAVEKMLEGMVVSPAQSKNNFAMDTSMISRLKKAKQYADERDRVRFESFVADIKGENSTHTVSYEDGKFHCDCSFFSSRGYCSHSIAMERVLENMLPKPASQGA